MTRVLAALMFLFSASTAYATSITYSVLLPKLKWTSAEASSPHETVLIQGFDPNLGTLTLARVSDVFRISFDVRFTNTRFPNDAVHDGRQFIVIGRLGPIVAGDERGTISSSHALVFGESETIHREINFENPMIPSFAPLDTVTTPDLVPWDFYFQSIWHPSSVSLLDNEWEVSVLSGFAIVQYNYDEPAVVPEPTSLLLLGSGLVAAALRRRR